MQEQKEVVLAAQAAWKKAAETLNRVRDEANEVERNQLAANQVPAEVRLDEDGDDEEVDEDDEQELLVRQRKTVANLEAALEKLTAEMENSPLQPRASYFLLFLSHFLRMIRLCRSQQEGGVPCPGDGQGTPTTLTWAL